MSTCNTLFDYEVFYQDGPGPIQSFILQAHTKECALIDALGRLFRSDLDEDFDSTLQRLGVEVRRIYRKYKEGDPE